MSKELFVRAEEVSKELAHGGHWPGGGKGCAFPPCPTASVKVGALFKGQPCWGSRPQTAGATPPLHPVGRKCAFDGRKAVKSAFALLSQKVTKAAAGAAKGVLI